MNDYPLVTIVTPSYNHAHFIKETIESVLSQDYPNIEYIVMDGGSSDGTAAVVAPYSDRLTFISESDRGQSHAINKGFAIAQGKIVAWLNSDDLFLPGAISKAVRAFSENPNAGVVYGEGYQIDFNGTIKSRFPHTQAFDLWRLVHMSDYILQQSVFFRKAALDSVGPIREDLHYIMDWDILIRLGKRFDFVYIPEYLGCLREYDTTKTSAGGRARAREIRETLRSHTGKSWPEGYIVYGLDSYSRYWGALIENWPAIFDPIKVPLRRHMVNACHRIIGRVATHGQGLYGDRWISDKARLMLRAGQGEIVFKGILPDLKPLEGQTITISVGGSPCIQRALNPGIFEIRFAGPKSARDRALTFEVKLSKVFVPSKLGTSLDKRSLSMIFEEFNWAEGNCTPHSD